MELDLSLEDRKLIICIINARPAGIVQDAKQANMLLHFADLLEYCGEVGTTLHIN